MFSLKCIFTIIDKSSGVALAGAIGTSAQVTCLSPPLSPSGLMFTPAPPHDPAVVTSALKHFLRNLPEPVLTAECSPAFESACDSEERGRRQRLGDLVHTSLPRPHRYLLAWLLQHMTRVIDRAADNKMTLANLIIVLSPTLQMSHRLLALFLSEPKDGG